jgi:hypothetical protein
MNQDIEAFVVSTGMDPEALTPSQHERARVEWLDAGSPTEAETEALLNRHRRESGEPFLAVIEDCTATTVHDHTGERVKCDLPSGHPGTHERGGEARDQTRYVWGW